MEDTLVRSAVDSVRNVVARRRQGKLVRNETRDSVLERRVVESGFEEGVRATGQYEVKRLMRPASWRP